MKIERNTISQQIRDYILQQIGSGELAPGQRIMENRIAGEMGVSPIPVREAIRELVATNVLESAPNKGAWVRQVSIAETIEALHVRSVLEPLAVRLAGSGIETAVPTLRTLARGIVTATERGDYTFFQKQNHLFHSTIVKAANNSVLFRVWDSMTYELGAQSVIDAIPHADPREIGREHELIVDALQSNDRERACVLLGAHSLGLIDYLKNEQVRTAQGAR
jgi:DNA-binding GntR family transcriptional regulator